MQNHDPEPLHPKGKPKNFSLKGSLGALKHQNYFHPKPTVTPEQIETLKHTNLNTTEVSGSDINRTVVQVGMLLMEQVNEIHKRILSVSPDLKENYILQSYPTHYISLPDGDGSINLYQRIIHKKQELEETGQGPTLEEMVDICGDKHIHRDMTGWYIRAHIHLGIPREALERIPVASTDPTIDQPEDLIVPVEDLSPPSTEVPIARAE